MTIGLFDAVLFHRAGDLVSIPAVIAAPVAFVFLLVVEASTKIASIYPVARYLRPLRIATPSTPRSSMLTGLTFGTIAALFGLSHDIIDKSQYSVLVAVIIAMAIIPTMIANSFFLPHHLLPDDAPGERAAPVAKETQ